MKNYKTFVPANHPVKLPFSDYEIGEDPEYYHMSFRTVAMHVYWMEVKKICRKKHCGILEARKLFHATGVLPPDTAMREAAGDDRFWHHEDLTVREIGRSGGITRKWVLIFTCQLLMSTLLILCQNS